MKDIASVYLNGQFMDPDQAQVSVFDRGFMFGDGLYEVIPVFGNRPFRLPQHLQRLRNNLGHLDIKLDVSDSNWAQIIAQLITDNGNDDQSVYIQITRGSAQRDHSFPDQSTPTVLAYSQTLKYPDRSQLEKGVSAITGDDIRWRRCDIKATALLANVLMRQRAKEQDVAENILLREGKVTEGAASNIFIVKNGHVSTAAKSARILPGITRDLVIELLQQNNINFDEADISENELFDADEVWMTSSTKEILAITHINNKAIGSGKPGPMHKKIFAIYQTYKQAFRDGTVD